MKKIFLSSTTFLIIYCMSLTQVTLPSIFSDGMILQQKTEVGIWGWAKPGSDISITPSWSNEKSKTKADKEGSWTIHIPTPSAGGPYKLEISDGTPIVIKNILIGEVWLCSGQSNMEIPMKGYMGEPILGSNEAILRSLNPNIHLITVPRASKTIPQNNFEGAWLEASPKTVADFSAIGYYFGKSLYDILDVPIGLINVSYGGSCIQAWMSKNTSVPFRDAGIPKPEDSIKVPNRTPTALFNGMLHPVIGYGIKGCIWYQGETNCKEPDLYPELFSTMVEEWRSLWAIGEFPLYYVQIAPFDYVQFKPHSYPDKFNSAYFREAQEKSMALIPNSGMVVLTDVGDKNTIHPFNKKVAGERLAYLALAKTYNFEGFGYQSPIYKAIEIKDTAIIVAFDNVDKGITSYGKKLTTFEIAGEDKIFYPAKTKLRRKSVIVWSPEVKKPVAVRYAFKDFVVGELFGTDGLPVSSFRTDNW